MQSFSLSLLAQLKKTNFLPKSSSAAFSSLLTRALASSSSSSSSSILFLGVGTRLLSLPYLMNLYTES